MKKRLQHIAFYPLSFFYGLIAAIRNWLFDQGFLKSTSFSIPIISVGNLSMGGTGKTPHTEFILSILQTQWKVAMLSRGYKRETSDFHLADEKTDAQTIGDEPFQIYRKFPDVKVAVHEKRVAGVNRLLELFPDLQAVVLDDAFQHRSIQAGFSVLLTDYANRYTQDLPFPAGNLREWKSGSKRADIIIVTKCPPGLKPIDMRLIEREIAPANNQLVLFSGFAYGEITALFPEYVNNIPDIESIRENNTGILLVAGIAKPEPLIEHIKSYSKKIFVVLFGDHHSFQPKDYNLIISKFDQLKADEKIIIVTEKDAARMISDPNFPEQLKSNIFALPVRVEILNNQEKLFIQKIKNYVVENSRNC